MCQFLTPVYYLTIDHVQKKIVIRDVFCLTCGWTHQMENSFEKSSYQFDDLITPTPLPTIKTPEASKAYKQFLYKK